MSKVEVDQVTQQSGTTLTVGGGACKTAVVDATTVTLGRCGGTVSLASGATQSGFGRTGTVDWVTTPKTATFTAATGSGYFVNTTGGVITVNLPAGAAGSIVSLADYAATWQTNNVTVTPNGSEKIGSVNTSVVLNTEGQSVTLVYVDSTQGWINTMDSTSNVRGNAYMIATVSGACNTLSTAPDCADTKIATFLGPGTFCVSSAAVCAANNIISHLIVAGGGGAGSGSGGGGGGGGGGYREVKSPSATGYTASPLDGYATPGNRITVTATGYPITIGGGGAGQLGPTADSGDGSNGNNSVFSTITSALGGYGTGQGGPYTGGAVPGIGGPGGSGGGGRYGAIGGTGNTPPVSPAQGFNGGDSSCTGRRGGGGGGGATTLGINGTSGTCGEGGTGTTTSISASSLAYSGGGGGGGWTSGPDPMPSGLRPHTASPCGTGGASAGGPTNGANGTTNRGGGGGASGNDGGGAPNVSNGGTGGSGIVIIRYKFQ